MRSVHAANITGQLRQVTLGSIGSTQAFGLHPDACLFLSADFNPDDDDTLLSGKNSCALPPPLADHAVVADESGLSQSAGIFARLRRAQKGTAKRICPSLTMEMPVNVAKRQKGGNQGR